jgi:hypothetical protein
MVLLKSAVSDSQLGLRRLEVLAVPAVSLPGIGRCTVLPCVTLPLPFVGGTAINVHSITLCLLIVKCKFVNSFASVSCVCCVCLCASDIYIIPCIG